MIEKLRDIVGAANVLTAPQDTRPYFTDWRRQYSASAECVVRPASTAEVAAGGEFCAQAGPGLGPPGRTPRPPRGAGAPRPRRHGAPPLRPLHPVPEPSRLDAT